jgi:ribosome-associated toxin RatA of RatAB toxin-antitoxin module
MDREKVFWGATLGFAVGMLAVLSRHEKDRIEIDHTLPAPPERVIDLVAQVEREQELIPGVHGVEVLQRGPDCVRYRVDLAGGAYALYCKTWEADRIAWNSEGGTFGLKQTGMMRLAPLDGGTQVHLTVETSFETPGLGRLATAGSHPFAAYAFHAWLENLGRALQTQ